MLVVDTIGIKQTVRLRGVPHSEKMRIDERLKLVTHDMLQDEVTITDPDYLERALDLHRRLHPHARLQNAGICLRE